MPLRCTCGAILPEDARFCHKCGKPQYESDIEQSAAAEAVAAPNAPPALPPALSISFSNSRAVSVSLLVAGMALVGLFAIAMLAAPLAPLVLCAAGFGAVSLYMRRSPETVSTTAGARLGWMTGLWLFLVMAVISAITSIAIADPATREQLRKVWSRAPEMAKLLDDPHKLLMEIVGNLVVFFFFFTLLPGLGGILGAKLLTRRRRLS